MYGTIGISAPLERPVEDGPAFLEEVGEGKTPRISGATLGACDRGVLGDVGDFSAERKGICNSKGVLPADSSMAGRWAAVGFSTASCSVEGAPVFKLK